MSKFLLIHLLLITCLLTSSITDCVSQTIFELPYTPRDVVFSDYDLDGDNDIFISCPSSDTIVLLKNNEFGSLDRIDFPYHTASFIFLEKVNDDEFPDIITGGTGGLKYYLNDGNGEFEETPILIPHDHDNIRFEDVKDMDNNGYPDIIYYAYLQPYGWGIIYNNGDETFTDVFIHQSESVEYPYVDYLNYDNKPDILLSSSATYPGNYIAYNYDPDYIFDTLCDHSEAWVYNYVIDIDADGDNDILFGQFSLSAVTEYLFYVNVSNENFVESGYVNRKAGTRIDVVSDLDGDGYQDIACISRNNSGSSTDSIYILKNNQNNGFVLIDQVYMGEPGTLTDKIYSGDLNGDGLDELLVTGFMNPTVSHTRILWNDGTGHFIDTNIVSTNIQPYPELNIVASPNPFRNIIYFNIRGHQHKETELKIYNTQGELMYCDINSNTGNLRWNGRNVNNSICPSGVYIADIIIDGEKRKHIKIVKY
ncbi:MAG: T9SS type A sorting domain-containing protein [Cyclobacteriaceae bacterium]